MPHFRLLLSALLVCACGLAQISADSKQRIRSARDLAKQGSDAIPKLQPIAGT